MRIQPLASGISPATALTFLLCLCLSSVSAQSFINMDTQTNQPSLNFRILPEDKNMEGSPYYKDQWEKGIVHQKNDTYAKLDEMKYDVRMDELIFRHEGNIYKIPKKVQIDKFQIGVERFVGAFDQMNNYSFYHVMEGNDNLYLLKKYDCTIKKGEPSRGYIEGTKDRYVIKERIFVKKENQNALEVNPRKGEELLEVLNDEEKVIAQEYIEKNKLKMKKLADLEEVVRHLNDQTSTVTSSN